jgi:tripartite-type tricarboxylate transporter receptor subunit TctC
MVKLRAGIDILHVPLPRQRDALNDLLPNTVQMMNEINVLPHVKAGKPILPTSTIPPVTPDFPDVPTLTELGYPDPDVPIWYLICAPAGTPKQHRAEIQRQAHRALQDRGDDHQVPLHQRHRPGADA